ncbi:MAG TPA: penicillin acylase family protein [Anaerolineae bacterium]|nr:penicillin acylase family protein [Anaerolineae bacterium]
MRLVRRILMGLVILIVLLAALVGGGYYYLSHRAFPQVDGTLQVSGLTTPVSIIRDKSGIPHIYASNTHDLFFAQGYTEAQDRLWEMEVYRIGISGRTSELQPSSSSLETDKFVLTLGFRRAAQADLAALDPKSLGYLKAFADGVNAFISTHQNTLPLEFTIVGLFGSKGANYKPEPWSPVDSLEWAKAMAWNLGGNWQDELFNAQILAKFGDEPGKTIIVDLKPAYDYKSHPIVVPSGVSWNNVPSSLANLQTVDSILGLRGRDIGSNNWTIAGSHTTTGLPILANDPHLGIQIPSIWYFNGLHCKPVTTECPFEVIGATFPGVPGVVIGHNAKIAWGLTNVGPDVQDLFLEKITGNQYEYRGQQVDLTIVPETIKITGQLPTDYTPSTNETSVYDEAANLTTITLNVRVTRHGPIISDVDKDTAKLGYPVAFAWTAVNAPERTIDSVLGVDTASNWNEFLSALAYFGSPSQNFVYADVDGNIGYHTPGRIPVRAKGDGQLPVPGWTGEYEWTGYIPFSELPQSFNPDRGYILTANNAIVGPDYPYLISRDWDRGYRARRISDLLSAKLKLSADDIAAIQVDDLNLSAQEIQPYLTSLTVDGDAAKVLDAIKTWDFKEQRASVGATAYEVFWYYLLRNTFDDELGDLASSYVDGGDVNREAMGRLLSKVDAPWWDNVTTSAKEARDDILKKSLTDAAKALTTELGSDPAGWTWSKVHAAVFRSRALGTSPVAFIFNRGPIPVDGGTAIVNNTGGNFSDGYSDPADPTAPSAKLTDIFAEQTVPSLRQIIDLSDLNKSIFINTTGQSGLPTHPHYDDMIDPWRNIQYVPMWWAEQDIKSHAEGTLMLTP